LTEDPFLTLGVEPEAGDDDIKRAYLTLVRKFSPERDPARFQEIRAAYETIRDRRGRLRARLLGQGGGALARLKRAILEPAGPAGRLPARVSRATVNAVLHEGLTAVFDPAKPADQQE